jgi:hypothetical protein
MNDLKIGDIVEINFLGDRWEERIFVKYAMDGSVCYIEGNDENSFKTGGSFRVNVHYKWRKKQEPKYIPFTYSDRKELRGKYVRRKGFLNEFFFTQISQGGVVINEPGFKDWDILLNDFIFADTGKPCGKEVKE